MPTLARLAFLGPWIVIGCVQSASPLPSRDAAPPGGTMLLLEDIPGNKSFVRRGDRVTVDLVGRYATGEIWGEGPLTFLYTEGAFAGASQPVQLGARVRTEWLRDRAPYPQRVRYFEGLDNARESFAVRSDRGAVTLEYTVRRWCRPMELFIMESGFGTIKAPLGCWRYPRFLSFAPGGFTAAGRAEAAVNDPDGGGAPTIVGPDLQRPPRDTAAERAVASGDLHAAAMLGRPVVAGELLRTGADANARDTLGLTPLQRLLLRELDGSPYVFQDEGARLATLDTLIAHGADVNATPLVDSLAPRVRRSQRFALTAPLDVAAQGCADGAVKRLLAAGATPRAVPGEPSGFLEAVIRGCPEVVRTLLDAGVRVDAAGEANNTPLERLTGVGAFHAAHITVAQHLLAAGAQRDRARQWLKRRLDDPSPGGFGFKGRHIAAKILTLLEQR